MIYTALTLPRVSPMMVRRFTPTPEHPMPWKVFHDKLVWLEQAGGLGFPLDVEEVGEAETRMPFDRDVVDQSHGVLDFTTTKMLHPPEALTAYAIFTSCRWRNLCWEKGDTMRWPEPGEPLLFIGNPYCIFVDQDGSCEVYREPSYLIRSGTSLQYEEPSVDTPT